MAYGPRTNDILVNTATAGNQTMPNVTRLADGRMFVVWGGPTNINADQHAVRS